MELTQEQLVKKYYTVPEEEKQDLLAGRTDVEVKISASIFFNESDNSGTVQINEETYIAGMLLSSVIIKKIQLTHSCVDTLMAMVEEYKESD